MKVSILAILAVILANTSCIMSVMDVPTPTPTVSPTIALTQTATVPTSTPSLSPTEAGQTAKVVMPVVQIHETAGGVIMSDKYLTGGDTVTVDKCSDSWCHITQPVDGYVWQGCLSEVAGELKCEESE